MDANKSLVAGVSLYKDWNWCGRPGYSTCTADSPHPGSAYADHPDAVFQNEGYVPNFWWNDGTTRSWKCPHCGQTLLSAGEPPRKD